MPTDEPARPGAPEPADIVVGSLLLNIAHLAGRIRSTGDPESRVAARLLDELESAVDLVKSLLGRSGNDDDSDADSTDGPPSLHTGQYL